MNKDKTQELTLFSFPEPGKTKPPEDIKKEYIHDFILSWRDLLDSLETTALQIEAGKGDDDSLAKVKRMLHTIKGDAAVIGFPAISDVFHQAEDILEEHIDRKECPTEYLLALKDWLQQVIQNLETMETPDSNGKRVATAQTAPENAAGEAKKMKAAPPLKVLIAEDDFAGRLVLQKMMAEYVQSDLAVDGKEALRVFRLSLESGRPYNLIFLDIMMPGMNGQDVLKEIRRMEEAAGILGLDGAKIVMTTALDDRTNVMQAFREQCDGYLVKPIERNKLITLLKTGLNFEL